MYNRARPGNCWIVVDKNILWIIKVLLGLHSDPKIKSNIDEMVILDLFINLLHVSRHLDHFHRSIKMLCNNYTEEWVDPPPLSLMKCVFYAYCFSCLQCKKYLVYCKEHANQQLSKAQVKKSPSDRK